VLVEGATVPKQVDLPPPLQRLAFRNAIQVRPDPDFHNDMERLCDALSQFVERQDKTKPESRRRPFIMLAAVGLLALLILLAVLVLRPRPTVINNVTDLSNKMTVINNVSVIVQEYAKYETQSLTDELKRQIEQAVAAATEGKHEESIQLFEKIAAKAPLPAIYTNLGVEYAKINKPEAAQAAFGKALEKDPGYEAARENNSLLAKAPTPGETAQPGPINAVTVEKSPLAAIVIEPLRENPEAVKEVHVVDSGTALSGSYTIRYSLKPDSPTLVDAGKYDIVLKMAGGGNFVLARDVEVKEQTRVRINPNAILGAIFVEPLTRTGFPEIKKLHVFEAGTTGYRLILQSAERPGVSLPIVPGKYDIECETADDNHLVLSKNIEVKARQVTRIRPEQEVAAIVVHDPKLSGLQLQAIYVLEAGGNRIISETKAFDHPMMVHAGDTYDVAIKQPGGLARLKTGITAKPGELIEVP
jgi:tetratricopeptide (TPR) repeat protein